MTYVIRGLATSTALSTVDDYVDDVEAALYGTVGIASFPNPVAAANNVSLAEVIRYIQETQIGTLTNTGGTATIGGALGDVKAFSLATRLDNIGTRMVSKAITLTAATTSYNVFTVTGLCAAMVVGYITTALTNHADTASLGTATSAAGLIAATAGTAMQTANQVWVDAAPTKFENFPTNWSLIGDGEDIVMASTANLTGGVISFYCWYIPISSGSGVVAA